MIVARDIYFLDFYFIQTCCLFRILNISDFYFDRENKSVLLKINLQSPNYKVECSGKLMVLIIRCAESASFDKSCFWSRILIFKDLREQFVSVTWDIKVSLINVWILCFFQLSGYWVLSQTESNTNLIYDEQFINN